MNNNYKELNIQKSLSQNIGNIEDSLGYLFLFTDFYRQKLLMQDGQ